MRKYQVKGFIDSSFEIILHFLKKYDIKKICTTYYLIILTSAKEQLRLSDVNPEAKKSSRKTGANKTLSRANK